MTFKFVKEYHLLQGFLFSLLIAQFTLALRIQNDIDEEISNLIGAQFFVFLFSFSIWISNFYFIKNKTTNIPGFQTLLGFISSIILSMFFYYLSPFYFYPVLYLKSFLLHEVLMSLILRAVLVFAITYPIQYYLFRDNKSQSEKLIIEKQKQEALHLRLAFLGKQLDPHFLFNSLSVLRAGTDDLWVKNYVNKLTQVYRYTLQNDINDGLALVEDEIEFVQSYLSLFQERFEDALSVNISINDIDKDAYLPRLSLQLLIENALKHNQFTVQIPLYLEIFNDGNGTLVVRNNLQMHTHSEYKKVPSGIGLKNLMQRYKLLNKKEIEIIQDHQYYTVKIPIIKKE